jgi:hypothetical protein
MGATLSTATCTIFGPTFPVQSNAIALRFAHRRLGPKLIAVAAQLTKIKYSPPSPASNALTLFVAHLGPRRGRWK